MKYNTLHKQIRKLYGKPSLCEQCGIGDARCYDWANISGRYNTTKRWDWKRLCRRCHIHFDKSNEKVRKAVLMIWPNGSWIKFESIKLASNSTGINYKSISNVVNGRAIRAGKYNWRLVKA